MKRKETVTRVIDGDTFETSRRKHPVRLGGRRPRKAPARLPAGQSQAPRETGPQPKYLKPSPCTVTVRHK